MFMKENSFHGPSLLVSATCSSGNEALLVAKLWLDTGKADDVVVVSCDLSLTPEVVAGFVNMGAAVVDAEPLDACRPFQDGGAGFPPGEAAVSFVLSSGSTDAYAELLGGAMTSDAYHATGMDPSNYEVIRCAAEALRDAQVEPADVAYLNAHGTGTAQCAAAETDMMERIFPGDGPHIYALKPLLGHCLASAGSIELAAGLMAYKEKTVPAPRIVSTTHHQRLLDGVCDFEGGVTLKTSMGMGGYNSAVLIGLPAGVGRKTFASESCVPQTGGHRDG
jgi:3-oxoacyl-[acyl-carrier-protein] synthase II